MTRGRVQQLFQSDVAKVSEASSASDGLAPRYAVLGGGRLRLRKTMGYYANGPGGYDIIVKLGGADGSGRE